MSRGHRARSGSKRQGHPDFAGLLTFRRENQLAGQAQHRDILGQHVAGESRRATARVRRRFANIALVAVQFAG
jgi:hypothetical protein